MNRGDGEYMAEVFVCSKKLIYNLYFVCFQKQQVVLKHSYTKKI